VLVKSFALELEEGNPASRRWVETRFLTKQGGEWYGYSYAWNEEQTEGTLVGAAGLDRDFTVRVPASGGVRKQTWHYPSRSECMVCHSRAANFVLGLTELQMNREHDYGKVRDNQLRTLEHLGVLRINWVEDLRTALREEAKAKGMRDKEADAYVKRETAARLQREPKESPPPAFRPDFYRRLADPYDPKEGLEARARSYLHANCAQCHVEAGGGNAQMELEYTTDLAKARILDVKPVHHTFNLPDARLVAPGSPERSVLLYRVSNREAGHMPPLATNVVDRAAVKVLHDWIKQLPPAGKRVGRKDAR
jgi:mono/diheme cytochrome c family protein